VFKGNVLHVRSKVYYLHELHVEFSCRDFFVTEEEGELQLLDSSGKWIHRLPLFLRVPVNGQGKFYFSQRIFTLGEQWQHAKVLLEFGAKCMRVYDVEENFIKLIPLKDAMPSEFLPRDFFNI
jgi:hypothetical protein